MYQKVAANSTDLSGKPNRGFHEGFGDIGKRSLSGCPSLFVGIQRDKAVGLGPFFCFFPERKQEILKWTLNCSQPYIGLVSFGNPISLSKPDAVEFSIKSPSFCTVPSVPVDKSFEIDLS